MNLHYIAIAVFFLLSASINCASATTVEGIILTASGSVINGTIKAYPSFAALRQHKDSYNSSPGKKQGEYKMQLPPGKYYFTAQGTDSNQNKLFAYHGLNPITIGSNDKWIPFFTAPVSSKKCQDGFQGIGGKATYHGKPITSGSVSVYSVSDEPFRGMGILTNTIDENGLFWFDLEPGNYMIIGRKRNSSDAIGPLRTGDLFCYSPVNPINLRPAQSCEIELPCYPRNDINSFLNKDAADPRGQREATRRHASLEGVTIVKDKTGETTQANLAIIAGRVTDQDDLPISNLLVSAYPADDLKLFQMYIVRFKSGFMTHTNNNGMFRMEVQGGSYYIVAREKFGEAPVSGEYYGLYEGNSNHMITINPGETKNGIQIIASPVMP